MYIYMPVCDIVCVCVCVCVCDFNLFMLLQLYLPHTFQRLI